MDNWKKWQCFFCGHFYDEELGAPADGISAHTRWKDVPEEWCCPDCGVGKADFHMIEVEGWK